MRSIHSRAASRNNILAYDVDLLPSTSFEGAGDIFSVSKSSGICHQYLTNQVLTQRLFSIFLNTTLTLQSDQ